MEDLIRGKHLLIVPSGPLTQLPFQVLVTAPPPTNGDHRSVAWLIREHALTVLPAVSSLEALRRVSRPSAATKPMIGFGNPLLTAIQTMPMTRDARGSPARSSAAPGRPWGCSTLSRAYRGVMPVTMRGGVADVKHILRQAPLPETADELCAVARDLGADPGEIRLGARATKGEVKKLSASGELARYRIVHFATHGRNGRRNKRAQASQRLTLTPPARASAEDDGYLSASDVAGLKLDADWVILSACNTAAGDAKGAEALSGLARAFIYAQARALLVSHWSVGSVATVKLVTGAIKRLAASGTMGRPEALRQSMLALIDEGEPYEAHPSLWAPFVVVGEGAR